MALQDFAGYPLDLGAWYNQQKTLEGGESLAQSESFDLPHKAGETISVVVMIDR